MGEKEDEKAIASLMDMLQADEEWQERALVLLEKMARALYRTTRLLASKGLSLTEEAVPELNETLLEQARAFLKEHKAKK